MSLDENVGASKTDPGSCKQEPVLSVKRLQVSFRYSERQIHAVRGVDLELYSGRTLAVVGESGSGKSVTAKSIVGLLPPTAEVEGSISYRGSELVGRRESDLLEFRGRAMSIIFQDPMRSLNPTMLIGRQIAEGVKKHFGVGKAEGRTTAKELLAKVGIPDPDRLVDEYPHQLSGGMRQRVMIAIAISCKPSILIADEPTTALDATTSAQIMELIEELQAETQMAVCLITHDLGLAMAHADDIAVMYAGRIVEEGSLEKITARIRMPYTRGLFDAVPRMNDVPHERFKALPGRAPDASADLVGCAFAQRCGYVTERCTRARPNLEGEDEHRWACWNPL